MPSKQLLIGLSADAPAAAGGETATPASDAGTDDAPADAAPQPEE